MSVDFQAWVWRFIRPLQIAAMLIFALGILATSILSTASLFGVSLLPELYLQSASGARIDVTTWLLIGTLALCVLLLAFMPANFRLLALENSHRTFRMRMEDVARAYWACHEADRSGLFQMASEFDAVRERFVFLRDHPDLGQLEPDVLDVAAQMSRTSEELASIYSNEKVSRAQSFLSERRFEAEKMEARIEAALDTTRSLRRLVDEVEMEESVAQSRLQQLRSELDRLLPKLNLAPTQLAADGPTEDARVLDLPRKRRGKAASE